MSEITIIGGGLAGLTAAVACAEGGADVVVHEAHATLGGRARTSDAPWRAQEGPHAFYVDGPHWQWLVERNLVGPVAAFPLRGIRGTWFHRGGRLRRTPPAGLLPLLAHRRRRAPVDVDFHTWAAALHGEEAARAAANLVGVITFDSDPGRLSAAFVWDLLLRVTAPGTPIVRWPVGGWPAVVDRLAGRARELGVRIATSSRVDTLPTAPVIVATQLESARSLLGDDTLAWESGACVLLDVGVVPDRRDAFFIADLDDAGLVERVSGIDSTLAPAGHSLV
jgi:glycine/D-amino acid oxidase-like deaminating enzyme